MICTLSQIYSGDGIERNEMMGHVARMGKVKSAYNDLVGDQRERDHLEGPDVDAG